MGGGYKLDIEILDILKDKTNLIFKRDSHARIDLKNNIIEIKEFYPMNLLQKLSTENQAVNDWKNLVESVLIDYDYDGNILKPQILDIPGKNESVIGFYSIPENHGKIKIKITDLLSESLEIDI